MLNIRVKQLAENKKYNQFKLEQRKTGKNGKTT
jgi:hypothetical protein